MASCGIAAGAWASFEEASKQFQGDNGVRIAQTGCGFVNSNRWLKYLKTRKPRVIYKQITQEKIIEAIKDYQEGALKKKWILGQMKDPRCVLEDIPNPVAGATAFEGIPFLGGYSLLQQAGENRAQELRLH